MAIVDFPTTEAGVSSITMSEATSGTRYPSWTNESWIFVAGSLPTITFSFGDTTYTSLLPWIYPERESLTYISLSDAQKPATYSGNSWLSPPWILSSGSFPTLPFTMNDYPYDPLLPWLYPEREDSIRTITLEQAKQRGTYEGIGFPDDSWRETDKYVAIGTYAIGSVVYDMVYVFSRIPTIRTLPNSPTSNGTLEFDGYTYVTRYYFDGNVVGNRQYGRSYSTSTPVTTTFLSITASNFDLYNPDGSLYLANTNLDPVSISSSIYDAGLGWEFGTVWAIEENVTFPWVIRKGQPEAIVGDPLSSSKFNIFVEADRLNGTMFYDNEVYRSLGWSTKIATATGAAGEKVTFEYDGPKIYAPNGEIYKFLASGTQDPRGPGGFAHYTDETIRTVELLSDRSNHINFYYIADEAPNYNYLMRVSTPDRVALIALMDEPVSEIKVQMHDGNIASVDLVPVDDEFASPIRVMTTQGIMALREVELYG